MDTTSRAATKPKFPLRSVMLAALLGAGLEIGVAVWTGLRQSWDTLQFAVLVPPGLALTAVVFAWLNPHRSVIGGVAAAAGQLLTMTLRAEDPGAMLPVALLIGIPTFAGVALLGLFVGRLRREAARDSDVHPGDPEDEEIV